MTNKKGAVYMSKLNHFVNLRDKCSFFLKKKKKIQASNYVKINFSDVIKRLSFE
jgi:hypothetical protein